MAKVERVSKCAEDGTWARTTYYVCPGWRAGDVVSCIFGRTMPKVSFWRVVAARVNEDDTVTYDLWSTSTDSKCWLTDDVDENTKLHKLRRVEEASKTKPRRKFRLGQDES